MDKAFVSKFRMAMREQLGKVEEWDPVEEKGNPCSSTLVESYLTFISEEQKQVGVPVKQAAPMLSHTLAQLLQSMRVRAQLAESLSQRIAITRDIALFSLVFYPMRRGFDLSITLASRVLRLSESAGLVFIFLLRKNIAEVGRNSGGLGRRRKCADMRISRGYRVHLCGSRDWLGFNRGLPVPRGGG